MLDMSLPDIVPLNQKNHYSKIGGGSGIAANEYQMASSSMLDIDMPEPVVVGGGGMNEY